MPAPRPAGKLLVACLLSCAVMPALLAEDLLNQMIPPLKGTDTTAKAARLLEEFHVGQLPVLAGRHYRGLITEHDLADYEKPRYPAGRLAAGLCRCARAARPALFPGGGAGH